MADGPKFSQGERHPHVRAFAHEALDVNRDVCRYVLRQAGVIARTQALGAGLSSRQIDRLTASGEWIRVHPGVYRLRSVVPTPESHARAASLWLGPAAVLVDAGAAWWWGMSAEAPPALTFGVGHHRRSPAGLRLECSFVDPRDQTTHRELRVLARPLAALRAAVAAETKRAGSGIALLDRAKQQRWVDADSLRRAFDRNRGTGGTAGMRTLLERTGDRAHSELERMAVALLRQAGITGFVLNHRTTLRSGRRVELDIAFPQRRVAIELDGYAYHADPVAHRSDLVRANEVMADGWVVRRFTYTDLLDDPDGFVRTVLETLGSRPH